MRFYSLLDWFIFLVKQKFFEIILLHKPFFPEYKHSFIIYMAILLADVLKGSDMRMREKLHHKGNPKNLLYKPVQQKFKDQITKF